jgi:hypothetical protein
MAKSRTKKTRSKSTTVTPGDIRVAEALSGSSAEFVGKIGKKDKEEAD